MIVCKHCGEEAKSTGVVDAGKLREQYCCPECREKGLLGEDFEVVELEYVQMAGRMAE
jgi:hypothetical protein